VAVVLYTVLKKNKSPLKDISIKRHKRQTMNSFNINKTNVNQKDIQKGQKIVAAIYLVTSHLSDSEPLKDSLRSLAVSLVCAPFVIQDTEQKEISAQIEILLGSCVLTGFISEKNSSVIVYEVNKFCEQDIFEDVAVSLSDLFSKNETDKILENLSVKDNKKTTLLSDFKNKNNLKTSLLNISQTKSYEKNILNKHSRQDKILSFINDRKSAVIKDITSLFPEVSEKTIQRELNILIDSGRITKRGTKRWSMYMSVNSLL
jgi:DeoR-like helix-turn-helix domain